MSDDAIGLIEDLETEDLEFDESFDDSDDAEARRRRIFGNRRAAGGGQGPRTALGRGHFASDAPGAFATKAEVRRGFEKVGADLRANGVAIKSVSASVASVQSSSAAQGRALVKQIKSTAQQTKDISGLRADVKKAQEMGLIMSLLMRPKSGPPLTAAEATATGLTLGDKINFEPAKGNSMLLPLLLMGGLGGGSGGSSDNSGMLLALVMMGGGL